MMSSRCARRAVPQAYKASTRGIASRGYKGPEAKVATISAYAARRQQHFIRSVATVTALGAAASAWQWLANDRLFRDVHAEEPERETVQFEKPRAKGRSKEDNRDILSSQHLQVRKSWENPGVYAWGSNTGKVVAPDSNQTIIKTPRRIPFFDGMVLRDLKLDRTFGAAIDDKGDLLQWGTGYSKDASNPEYTLRGKDLRSLSISRDRIIGLGSDGTVYSIPASKEDQTNGPKATETSSWLPLWSSSSPISYRKLTPPNLSWGEKVIKLAGGLEHVLLLTSGGRVFSAAAGTQDFPSKGQLGIPGLTWTTRPPGAYDQCHEITTLHGFNIKQIAAGDFHSLVADKDGRVFAFGDNTLGQLGLDYSSETPFVDIPALLPLQQLYTGTNQTPRVTGIAAGGCNSYFTVDATKAGSSDRGLGRVTADTWACGHGLWGGLANGRWTHVQATPTKVPAFSGLFEYDEQANRVTPIRLSRVSVGATHAAAVLDNVTHLTANARTADTDTNWGADVLFFGNNEFYQLGTGKRNNVSNPTYIHPLDMEAERRIRGNEEHRFQITPKKRVHLNGRSVEFEQRVECGRCVTAVYSGV